MIKICNDVLSVEVSELGAEIRSIRRVGSDHEYIWTGDATYWNGQAPLLFPAIGKLWNGQYRIDGQVLEMPKHGFARRRDFKVEEQTTDKVVLSLEPDDELLAIFPRQFKLSVTYRLDGNKVLVGWTVENRSNRTMPFQIGAHPAFCYADWHEDDAVHGYLTFEGVTDKLVSAAMTADGFRDGTTFDVALDGEGRLPLMNDTFVCDTIIELRRKTNTITLHDKQGRAMVTVRHELPALGIWSPHGGKAPFVCIEPWIGACDTAEYKGLYADRDIVHSLLTGETFNTEYSIELM
ncbi:MAG: aldose 1-epimerase family protein [Bacteroidaceae bacterium]|nr:aldose 1-epimerase family protein [Bacteroidaceae bacterium]